MKKAIIIGAGPAGLTAAYEFLKKTDIKPIIYEASQEIGGISKTVNYKGNRMDIGGHRFFSKNQEIMQLWDEIMPMQGHPSLDDKLLNRVKPLVENGPDPEVDDIVMLCRTRVSRIFYLKKFFDYPVTLNFQTIKNMGFKRTTKAGFGYMKSAMFKRKEDNLEDFMINRFGTPLYKMFFEDYTEKVWGRNPKEIGADWGAQRIKGLSLSKAVFSKIAKPFKKMLGSKKVETSLIEQFSYPKKGPGQLYETMAEKIKAMGGEIHMGVEINKIILNDSKIEAIYGTHDGKEVKIEGDYYISTMPIKDLFESIGQKSVKNDEVYNVATNLLYRDFITVGVLLNKLLLHNETKHKTLSNIIPDCWIYIQEEEVKMGRLQIFNNWSPYMLKDPANTVWIGLEYFCNEGDELWEMKKDDFITMAIDELAKIRIIDKADVLDSTQIKVKKAYPAYFGVYDKMNIIRDYINEIDNLYCIGRNGQHRYNNMDHSMLTAIEAVKHIASSNNKNQKNLIWNVNTESDYHETSKQTKE